MHASALGIDTSRAAEGETKVYQADSIRKNWRACCGCRLLQTSEQFMERGCPNCPQAKLNEREANEIELFTSAQWTGILSHFQAGGWLKRATHVSSARVFGSYALNVHDENKISRMRLEGGQNDLIVDDDLADLIDDDDD